MKITLRQLVTDFAPGTVSVTWKACPLRHQVRADRVRRRWLRKHPVQPTRPWSDITAIAVGTPIAAEVQPATNFYSNENYIAQTLRELGPKSLKMRPYPAASSGTGPA